jgi:hypothetical protein
MSIENHWKIFFPTVQLVQLHWNPIAAVMVSMLVSSVVECTEVLSRYLFQLKQGILTDFSRSPDVTLFCIFIFF